MSFSSRCYIPVTSLLILVFDLGILLILYSVLCRQKDKKAQTFLLLLLLPYRSLSPTSSPGTSPPEPTNSDPHYSSFQFQTAALSVLCVMFLV